MVRSLAVRWLASLETVPGAGVPIGSTPGNAEASWATGLVNKMRSSHLAHVSLQTAHSSEMLSIVIKILAYPRYWLSCKREWPD